MRNYFILLLLISVFSNTYVLSQVKKHQNKKLYNECVKLFMNEEFEKVLPMLVELDSLEPDNSEIRYYIGVCYLNKKNESGRNKSLEFLEPVIKENKLAFPPDVYKDIGELYHEKLDFKNAENMYRLYQQNSLFEEQQESNYKQLTEYTRNAKKMIKIPVKIESIKLDINTSYNEKNVFYNEETNQLFYNTIIYKINSEIDSLIIYKKYNLDSKTLDVLSFEDATFKNSYLAGISNNGTNIFICFNKDLYVCEITNDNKIVNVTSLDKINTPSDETYITSSADMKLYYFSSNIDGGTGGFDIYQVIIDDKGKWSKPKNLGTKINSKADEIIPIFNEKSRTLFYSSNGLNSIGNFDVFKSNVSPTNIVSKYVNLGYNISTTKNDFFYNQSSDLKNNFIIRENADNHLDNDVYKISFLND